MGLINVNIYEEFSAEITAHRPAAAVPFGGRYRLIDFELSSMVNSGISNVGILANNNARALLDHLRTGREWNLAKKNDGMFILLSPEANGDLQYLKQNLDYLQKSRQNYVLITSGCNICNLNYRNVFQKHCEMRAEVTLICSNKAAGDADYQVLTDQEGQVSQIVKAGNDRSGYSNTGMFLINKETLLSLIEQGDGKSLTEVFAQEVNKRKIFAYVYSGYLGRINSLQAYYRHNMDLLQPEIWQELFFKPGPIYTKSKVAAPVKYLANAQIDNAIIASGCIVGGRVEKSILFRGVKIGKNSVVKDSIIMQDCMIEDGAELHYAICDKNVRVSKGAAIHGTPDQPYVIKKGSII